jgi:Hint domain
MAEFFETGVGHPGRVTVAPGKLSNETDVGRGFAAGSCVLTDFGYRPVEELRCGDMVITRDSGLQPIRWIGRYAITPERGAARDFRPVCVAANAFGPGLPQGDLRLSPHHQIMLRHNDCEVLFGQWEVLVAAEFLLQNPKVYRSDQTCGFCYYHLLFDAHEIVHTNGLEAESLHPDLLGQQELTTPQRIRLLYVSGARKAPKNTRTSAARLQLDAREAAVLSAFRL